MTRTAISSCKQFNKVCVCYPAVITNWYPSTPHKGVNGDIRHDYTGSLPSRQTSLLCKELGGDYPGPMGSAGNSRVQIRPDSNPSPGKQASCAAPQSNRPDPDNRGDTRTAGQTCHKGISTLPKQFYFPTFLAEKKGGGQRPVVNLKALNNFVRSEHFKMESLHILPDLIQTGDYMIKLDLKDAYLQIPIYQDHQHLLQFQWMEKTYQFLCLPFGLTSAPRVFTKVLKPLIGTLWQIGIRLVVYLDDILILHQGREELESLAPLICNLFEALGLVINTKKSLLIPQQSTEFLGFLIKSMTLQIQMPQEKLRKIQQDARGLLLHQSVTVRDLARFVGKTTASCKAIWQAPLHYRGIQALMNSVSSEAEDNSAPIGWFNIRLPLSEEARQDLLWWVSLDRTVPLQAPLLPRVPSMIITSDAFTTGWGACLGDTTTGGTWSAQEMMHHINYLELLAAFLAVQCFLKTENNITILLKLDNVTAVTFINRLGGTHSKPLCQLALAFWEWCIPRNLFLIAEHLPGQQNVLADHESRSRKDRCDWMINPHLFHQIQDQLGPCQVDLFASRLTRQLPRYFSWRIDPEAEAVDAFKQDWSHYRGFANPPWCLIPRCLSQARAQKARLILLTPLWPSQAWYPVVLGMLEDIPRQLPNQGDLIFLHTGQEFQMPQGCPNLVAWPISGNPSHHEEFLQRLQHSSYPPGDLRPSPVTTQHLLNGLAGVTSRTEIPLLAL